MKKTILIPCYNEENTIDIVIQKVKKNISNDDNIIIIDDGSHDGTIEILKKYENDIQIECLYHPLNSLEPLKNIFLVEYFAVKLPNS